jgi:hypothetical protein
MKNLAKSEAAMAHVTPSAQSIVTGVAIRKQASWRQHRTFFGSWLMIDVMYEPARERQANITARTKRRSSLLANIFAKGPATRMRCP